MKGLLGVAWIFPLSPPQASTFSKKVDLLFYTLTLGSLILLFCVFFYIFYFSTKYRRGSRADRKQEHTHLLLEVIWIVIPFFMFVGVFLWSAQLYMSMNLPPSNAMNIYVAGKQWMWKFQHADGTREMNELHVPVDLPIRLTMTSEDVIHSLYIPAFRIKHDVLPERFETTWFQATQPGEYPLFCAEYCGTNHSGMEGRVIVLTQEAYAEWTKNTQLGIAPIAKDEKNPANSGRALYEKLACQTCHGVNGSGGGVGPKLENLMGSKVDLADGSRVIADENYIRESILKPNAKIVQGYPAVMPTFQGQVNDEELLSLLSYIQSLRSVSGSETQAPSENE